MYLVIEHNDIDADKTYDKRAGVTRDPALCAEKIQQRVDKGRQCQKVKHVKQYETVDTQNIRHDKRRHRKEQCKGHQGKAPLNIAPREGTANSRYTHKQDQDNGMDKCPEPVGDKIRERADAELVSDIVGKVHEHHHTNGDPPQKVELKGAVASPFSESQE